MDQLMENAQTFGPEFPKKIQSLLLQYDALLKPVEKADILIVSARATMRLGQPEACLKNLDDAISYLDPKNISDQASYSSCLLLKSQCFGSIGDFASGKKVLQELLTTLPNNIEAQANATANLGIIALLERNLSLSRNYILEAIRLGAKAYGPDHLMIANCYNNLAGVEKELENLDKEAEYLQKCIAIKVSQLGPESPALSTNYSNLAENFMERGDIQNAILLGKQAENIIRKYFSEADSELRFILIKLAEYYAMAKQRENALQCLSEAGRIQAQYFDPNDAQSTMANIYAASAYIDLEMQENAKSLLNQAASNIGFDFNRSPNFESLKQTENLHNYLQCQHQFYRFLSKSEPKYLDSLEKSMFQSLDFLEFESQIPKENNDRLLNTEASFEVFEPLINLLYQRNKKGNAEKIFTIMEKSKSRILRENILNSDAEKFSRLPDSLQSKAQALDEMILEQQALIQSIQNGSPQDQNISQKANQAQLLHLREERLKLIAFIKANHPEYYQLRYASETSKLAEIQAKLPKETALIEFFVGDTSIFTFCIRSESQEILRIPKSNNFKHLIQNFREGIYGYSFASERNPEKFRQSAQLFCNSAYQIYNQLLQPLESKLPAKLIIIPDGILHFVPFDALLKKPATEPTNFRNHAYLIRDFQISYHNSATLWAKAGNHHIKRQSKGVLAMAPEFKSPAASNSNFANRRLELQPLQNNREEAEAIQKLWSGELLLGTNANRQQFEVNASHYSIIHLATHAKANDDNGDFSFVAFSPQDADDDLSRLYAQDLFAQELDAELVVLSACETGIGEFRRGEGMLSLSRGFMYAGAKSTVTSLWEVNDASTKTIMLDFHRYLKKGRSKDESIRLAKLNYLENSENPHPYFWAAFVPFGDMKAIGNDSNGILWLILIAATLLAIIYLSKK